MQLSRARAELVGVTRHRFARFRQDALVQAFGEFGHLCSVAMLASRSFLRRGRRLRPRERQFEGCGRLRLDLREVLPHHLVDLLGQAASLHPSSVWASPLFFNPWPERLLSNNSDSVDQFSRAGASIRSDGSGRFRQVRMTGSVQPS